MTASRISGKREPSGKQRHFRHKQSQSPSPSPGILASFSSFCFPILTYIASLFRRTLHVQPIRRVIPERQAPHVAQYTYIWYKSGLQHMSLSLHRDHTTYA